MLTMILQHSICKRNTLSVNHIRRTLSEKELPYPGCSAPPVIHVLPDRTVLDCAIKARARTAQDLMGDSSVLLGTCGTGKRAAQTVAGGEKGHFC